MKCIAILSFDLWGFNKKIAEHLIQNGHQVIYINTEDIHFEYKNIFHKVSNAFSKIIFKKNLKKEAKNKKLLERIASITTEIDDFLIINPGHFKPEVLKLAKQKSKKIIAYNYDSLERVPLPKDYQLIFDEVFSFDDKDVINNNFKHITNFIYLEKVNSCNQNYNLKAFTVQFKDKTRLNILNKIADIFIEKKINNFEFYILGSKTKGINRNIKFIKKKLDLDVVSIKSDQSEIIIDIVHSNQSGLSFRVFEAMALEKKLITTNKSILNYDFYNPSNILVLNDNQINIPDSFLEGKFEKINPEIYSNYTIESWTKKVFQI